MLRQYFLRVVLRRSALEGSEGSETVWATTTAVRVARAPGEANGLRELLLGLLERACWNNIWAGPLPPPPGHERSHIRRPAAVALSAQPLHNLCYRFCRLAAGACTSFISGLRL